MGAKTSKKKPGKKVKPSRPAYAVLWGLDPSCGKGAQVAAVLREVGASVRVATPNQLGMPAGLVARAGAGVAGPAYDGSVPTCEFMLLCGFSNEQVNGLIAKSREAGCTVGAKALLTPANKNWSLGRLICAVAGEHEAMTGGERQE